jgi:P27 family predicted phage terminase small subunit
MNETKPRISAPSHHKAGKLHKPQSQSQTVAEPPESMSAAGAAEWRRVCPRLLALGMLPDLDAAAFALYCNAVGDLANVRAAWQLEGSPPTVQRPAGAREHPSINTLRLLGSDVAKFAGLLGLTPRSRKVLGVEVGALPSNPLPGHARSAEDARIASRYFND